MQRPGLTTAASQRDSGEPRDQQISETPAGDKSTLGRHSHSGIIATEENGIQDFGFATYNQTGAPVSQSFVNKIGQAIRNNANGSCRYEVDVRSRSRVRLHLHLDGVYLTSTQYCPRRRVDDPLPWKKVGYRQLINQMRAGAAFRKLSIGGLPLPRERIAPQFCIGRAHVLGYSCSP